MFPQDVRTFLKSAIHAKVKFPEIFREAGLFIEWWRNPELVYFLFHVTGSFQILMIALNTKQTAQSYNIYRMNTRKMILVIFITETQFRWD